MAQALHEHVRCASLDLGGNRISLKAAAALAPLLKAQRPDGTPRDVCAEETSALSEVLRLAVAASRPTRAPRCCRRRAASSRRRRSRCRSTRDSATIPAPAARPSPTACAARRARQPDGAGLRARPARRRRARGGAAERHALRHLDLSANAPATTAAAPSPRAAFCGLEELLLGSGSATAPPPRRPRSRRRRCAPPTRSAPTASATAARRRSPRRSARRDRRATARSRRSTSAQQARPAGVLALGDALVANGAVRYLELGGNARADADATRHRHARRAQPPRGDARRRARRLGGAHRPNAAASELVRVRVQQLYTNAYDVADVEDDAAAAGGGARPGAVVAARLAARDAEREVAPRCARRRWRSSARRSTWRAAQRGGARRRCANCWFEVLIMIIQLLSLTLPLPSPPSAASSPARHRDVCPTRPPGRSPPEARA